MATSEGKTREHVEQVLVLVDWKVQDRTSASLHAGQGVGFLLCAYTPFSIYANDPGYGRWLSISLPANCVDESFQREVVNNDV